MCGLKLTDAVRFERRFFVTPFVGVWIETHGRWHVYPCDQSHPSWVCGLKLIFQMFYNRAALVTPFVGVWIETFRVYYLRIQRKVTPFVGVWIETAFVLFCFCVILSHPSWVCGLKHLGYNRILSRTRVTPFVGVWIETGSPRSHKT